MGCFSFKKLYIDLEPTASPPEQISNLTLAGGI
jgi:hypothetical protein